MESLTGEDNTKVDIGDTNTTVTPEMEINLVSQREADDETQTLKKKNELLEREFEKAEETIDTLTKEKSEATRG